MRHTHLLTILYADQQSINKVPKIWGQLNEKGNGSSPDPFLARPRRALRKKGLACETTFVWLLDLYGGSLGSYLPIPLENELFKISQT